MRICIAAAALVFFSTAGGVVLAISYQPFDGSWLKERRQHLANTLPHDQDAGVVGALTADSGTGGPYTRRGAQEQGWGESWGNDTLVSASRVEERLRTAT